MKKLRQILTEKRHLYKTGTGRWNVKDDRGQVVGSVEKEGDDDESLLYHTHIGDTNLNYRSKAWSSKKVGEVLSGTEKKRRNKLRKRHARRKIEIKHKKGIKSKNDE